MAEFAAATTTASLESKSSGNWRTGDRDEEPEESMDTSERGAGGRYVGEASSVGWSASSSSMRISDRTARSASVVCSVSPSVWGVEVGGAT